MKKGTYLLGIILFSLMFNSCAKPENCDEIVAPQFSDFAEDVEQFLLEKKFSGAVLVANKKGIIFAKGYGSSNKKQSNAAPIGINSTFEIGSITKQMVAAAIMQLNQQKKLSVKDNISKYFPDYIHGEEITVEMLLNMHSGLTDYVNSPDNFFPRKVYRQLEKNAYSNVQLEKDFVLKYFYDAPLLSPPNQSYFYCNTNYYLLAKIIEQVSGLSYEEYMKQNIFVPCKMVNTDIAFRQTSVTGYDKRGRSYSLPSEFGYGCGDINSSVIDLYKWTKAFTSGKVVSKKSFKQMTKTESYGYGVVVQNGEMFHAGATNVFNSYCTYYPASKEIIIVLINQPQNEKLAATFARGIHDLLAEAK